MSGTPSYPVYIPRTFGQILDRVFRLVRANLKLLVGIAALPPAAIYAAYALIAAAVLWPLFVSLPKKPSPDEVKHLVFVLAPLVVAVIVMSLLVFGIYLAAASYASVQSDCGVKVTLRQSYAVAWSRAGRYALLLILIYVICFFPAIAIHW
jgi:hypothetical protein